MAPVTRRQLLELGLKLTGAATVLGLAGTACGPTDAMPDAGDDHGHDAGGDAPDAADSTPDAGGSPPDAGDETVDAGETPEACAGGAGATSISSNHGHAVSLPIEVLQAAGDESVSIQGSSGHDHSINLTAANKATLLAGGTVTITSSSGASHTHSVTLACVTG